MKAAAMPDPVRARFAMSALDAYCREPKQFAGAYVCSPSEAAFFHVCDHCGDIDVEFFKRKNEVKL